MPYIIDYISKIDYVWVCIAFYNISLPIKDWSGINIIPRQTLDSSRSTGDQR